jgi:hypothetical protein
VASGKKQRVVSLRGIMVRVDGQGGAVRRRGSLSIPVQHPLNLRERDVRLELRGIQRERPLSGLARGAERHSRGLPIVVRHDDPGACPRRIGGSKIRIEG